jgi:hypothetical protein
VSEIKSAEVDEDDGFVGGQTGHQSCGSRGSQLVVAFVQTSLGTDVKFGE